MMNRLSPMALESGMLAFDGPHAYNASPALAKIVAKIRTLT